MGVDTLSVVEAAYSLDVDDRGWLEGLVAAAGPLVDRGLGTYGYTLELGRTTLTDVVERDTPPQFHESLLAMHREASSAELGTSYSPPQAIITLSTQFGDAYATTPLIRRWVIERGFGDGVGLQAYGSDGKVTVLGAPWPVAGPPPRAAARVARRLVAHVVSGRRLRAELSATREPSAVLSPSAEVLHAEGDARGASAREALVSAVRAMERARGPLRRRAPDEALELWRGLVAGRWSLVERIEHDGRRFLVAHENEPAAAEALALNRRERQMLTHAALGRTVKATAYELGLSENVVSHYLSSAKAKTGLRSRAELVRWFGTAFARRGGADQGN